jgi:hypothetical protein
MYREFNIVNSFTLECSLCGPSYGARKDYHYSRKMLLVTIYNFIPNRIWVNNFASP